MENKDKLLRLISKANVFQRNCRETDKIIKITKNKWFNILQNKLEIMQRKAQRGGDKEKTAYMKLVEQKKFLE